LFYLVLNVLTFAYKSFIIVLTLVSMEDMMQTRYDKVAEGLLDELVKEEIALEEADDLFTQAKVKFDVARRKYVAVRDMVTKHLGESPYRNGKWHWRVPVGAGFTYRDFWRYRFILMSAGEAITGALAEVDEPLNLAEITERLRSGGVSHDEMSVRAINAALMKTGSVVKTEDGKYQLEPEPEDLPF
jgi:hypothetical protein